MTQRALSLLAGMLSLLCIAAGVTAADDDVLLRRGDITVTRADFMHMLESAIPPDGRASALADDRKVRMLIADLFVIRQLAADARQAGLDADPLIRFKIDTQADRTLMDALLDQAVKAAKAPDLEKIARERYIANPERFRKPEQVSASHILISVKEGRDAAQAKALAEEVRQQALAGKKSFEDLALEYSDDRSVQTNKGDLGFFDRSRMVKPFADAAFALTKPGEISPVVESNFGFHVIRFAERRPERQLAFDDVKRGIIEKERQKFESQLRSEKIEEARSLEGIEVNQEAITAISENAKAALKEKTANKPMKSEKKAGS